jgi:hypothetical protein
MYLRDAVTYAISQLEAVSDNKIVVRAAAQKF